VTREGYLVSLGDGNLLHHLSFVVLNVYLFVGSYLLCIQKSKNLCVIIIVVVVVVVK